MLAICIALICGAAHAGGGPENVFVVVNGSSWASQTVANHYIRLREIPPGNVLYLDWNGGFETTDVDTFRQKILAPVLSTIERRGLADQIDAIVYSSDFPYAVNLAADLGSQKPPKQLKPVASLTGATYLWQYTMTRNPNLIGLRNNQYMRSGERRRTEPSSHGFRGWYGWGKGGELMESGGDRYMLSTMLAVTSGRGNSVIEAIKCLRRGPPADGTRPEGTIYFCQNDDVRAKTRQWGFPAAVDDLKKLGVAAEILDTSLPERRTDVMGAMLGVANFSWPGTRSTIRPGALCDHLTSLAGVLAEDGGQTPLSEWIRAGASGTCGTVVEPYAIQDKFPVPMMYVHYARGCSLAESFYQSMYGPYQLLVVGDPLCQPWADIPAVTVEGVKPNGAVSGQLSLKPAAKSPASAKIDRFELFIDGRRMSRAAAGEPLELDTLRLADGYHELRVVAIDATNIETQGRLVMPIQVDNHHRTIELASNAKNDTIAWDERLEFSAKAPGMLAIILFHNGNTLGRITGDSGTIEVEPRQLGVGPVAVQAIGVGSGGPADNVTSKPLLLAIKPSAPLPAIAAPEQRFVRGMELKRGTGEVVPIQETFSPKWLSTAGVKPEEPFELVGYFSVPTDEMYQFQVWHDGDLRVAVDQAVLDISDHGQYRLKVLPVALAAGLHRLHLVGRAGAEVRLRILFGGQGTLSLDGAMFRHPQ